MGKAQPQGAVGNIVNSADGKQHMAGIQRAGGAGGAGGGRNALGIQQEQQGLTFDTLKAEADNTGQTMFCVTVSGTVRNLGQTGNQLVPQGDDFFVVFFHIGAGIFQCSGHTHNGRQIFCTGSLTPFLCAALNQVGQGEASADIQRTNAHRSVEFVGRKAQHINVLRFYINGNVTNSLHRVGVEGYTGFFASSRIASLTCWAVILWLFFTSKRVIS